jgi:hypothetical protein
MDVNSYMFNVNIAITFYTPERLQSSKRHIPLFSSVTLLEAKDLAGGAKLCEGFM